MASVVSRLITVCVFVVGRIIGENAALSINLLSAQIYPSRQRCLRCPSLLLLLRTKLNPLCPWHLRRTRSFWLLSVLLYCSWSYFSLYLSMLFVGNFTVHHPHRRAHRIHRRQRTNLAIVCRLLSAVHRRAVLAVLFRVPMPITGHAQSSLPRNGHWANRTTHSSVDIIRTIITITLTSRDWWFIVTLLHLLSWENFSMTSSVESHSMSCSI